MTTTVPQRETVLPGLHPEDLAAVAEFLLDHSAADDQDPPPRYFLSGAAPGDQVEIPAEVHRVLIQAVEAMRRGLAVTIAPQTMVLTTQQAADLLGVSRPTLIKLLDDQRISYERVGSHRRIQLRDLLAYRQQRRDAQYAALEATAAPLDDEDDAAAMLATLRRARKAIAEQRRAATA